MSSWIIFGKFENQLLENLGKIIWILSKIIFRKIVSKFSVNDRNIFALAKQ